jgi:hypothetical protein
MTEQTTETVEQAAEDTQSTTSQKTENMIPKTRFDEVNEKKKQAENDLNEVADMLLQDVPEDYRDLFSDLSAKHKIQKIKSAQSKGLFTQKVESSPEPERPKSSSGNVDMQNLTPDQKFELAMKQHKK